MTTEMFFKPVAKRGQTYRPTRKISIHPFFVEWFFYRFHFLKESKLALLDFPTINQKTMFSTNSQATLCSFFFFPTLTRGTSRSGLTRSRKLSKYSSNDSKYLHERKGFFIRNRKCHTKWTLNVNIFFLHYFLIPVSLVCCVLCTKHDFQTYSLYAAFFLSFGMSNSWSKIARYVR